MTERTPHDGKPYYCMFCRGGYAEFLACEMAACQLEPKVDAEMRRNRLARTHGERAQDTKEG